MNTQIVEVPKGSTHYRLGDRYVFFFPFELEKIPDGWIIKLGAVIVGPGVEVRFVDKAAEAAQER